MTSAPSSHPTLPSPIPIPRACATLVVLGLTAIVTPSRATNDGVWAELAPPGGRAYHTLVHDSARHRLLVFGGFGSTRHDQVWELALDGSTTWRRVPTTGAPAPARHSHAAIYDPVRDRLIVMGGYDGIGESNQVWALSLAGTPTWAQIVPVGTPPVPRQLHRAVYDSARDRMLIFGGLAGSSRNDVWALSLSGTPAWTEIVASGTTPAARFGGAVAYDAAHDRLLLFGGVTLGERFDDTWALSLAGAPSWSEIVPTGARPAARELTDGVYDPSGDRFVIFGGFGLAGALHDAWALPLSGPATWSELVANGGPGGVWAFGVAYDPVASRLVIHGGGGNQGFVDEAWALALAGSPQWTLVAPVTVRPTERLGHVAVHDPLRDRMLVFGGRTPTGTPLSDVWAYDLAQQKWTLLSPAGTPPSPRFQHHAVYDPVRDRLIVFGGAGLPGTLLGDVWALELSESPAWTPLAPTGTPPSPRRAHSLIYDSLRDRLVMAGGLDASGRLNDAWTLSLTGTPAWSPIVPIGLIPLPRWGHSAVYDAARDRMVMFGGETATDPPENFETWELPFNETPTWHFLAAGPARFLFGLIHDPTRDRLVMHGGELSDVPALSETFVFDLEQEFWSPLDPVPPLPGDRGEHAAIYDPVRDRMVIFGGTSDVWALHWSAVTSVPHPILATAPRPSLAPPFPNPAGATTTLRYSLTRSGAARLAIVDLAGRTVRELVDGMLPAGAHSATWDGRDERAIGVAPGVYWAVLRAERVVAVRRVVRLD